MPSVGVGPEFLTHSTSIPVSAFCQVHRSDSKSHDPGGGQGPSFMSTSSMAMKPSLPRLRTASNTIWCYEKEYKGMVKEYIIKIYI